MCLPQADDEFEEALSRCDSMLSALSFASAGSAAFGLGLGGLPYGPAALSRSRLASLSALGMARLGSVTGAGGRLADIEEGEDADEGAQQPQQPQQQGRAGFRGGNGEEGRGRVGCRGFLAVCEAAWGHNSLPCCRLAGIWVTSCPGAPGLTLYAH